MLKVIGCFVQDHDLRLVALAAVICALAAVTAIELVCYAHRNGGRARPIWLAVAALAGGSGIWATHFIAMLAFAPGLPSAYDPLRTVLSLFAAIALAAAGFAVAVCVPARGARLLGGAIVGGGIAVMHYTGMSAYEIAGHIRWNAEIVAVSITIGAVLGALALHVGLERASLRQTIGGTALLLLAIVGHHFTAMGAVEITHDPTLDIPASAISTNWLAAGVAFASLAILVLAGAALGLDIRERRHAARESERLQSLANAAVEGLVVFRDGLIVSANRAFEGLTGLDERPDAGLAGRTLAEFLPLVRAETAHDEEIVTDLRRLDGEVLPVEIIVREVVYADAPHLAVAVRDIRARRKAERQIQFLAHHDALTGLANRTSFASRLSQEIDAARGRGTKLAILCLDLDRFKEVNDLFGHAAGDAQLQQVARTTTGLLDETQVMARLGGDEFAILTPCLDAMSAGALAEEVIAAFALASDGPTPMATSIGIAIYPDDAKDPTALLSFADTALYRAKQEGRGTFRFFEQKMGQEVRQRRLLERDLRLAVARSELTLVYQPQMDIAANTIVGFEALLRWKHPTRGFVPPDAFIAVAEESGAIVEIGQWVLHEACRTAAQWPDHLRVAVNVSPVQMHGTDLAAAVAQTLVDTGLSPSRLELEITETAIIREPGRALHTMRQLKALGIRLAMDDFGTGYSSLSNLRSFPFDKLKIDRSFIEQVNSNEQAAAIVSSVLVLGEGLDMEVVAEGVETPEELAFLARHNCQGAQGYLFGRPLPIPAFAPLTAAPAAPAGDDDRDAPLAA